MMDIEKIKKLIADILPQNVTHNKPHKALVLLSIIQGIEENKFYKNEFYYDLTFKELFTKLFNKYKRQKDSNRPYTPFFHLRSSKIWELVPREGKEEELETANSVGGPGKLNEIVQYAVLNDKFYSLLLDSKYRNEIKQMLIGNLENNIKTYRFENKTNESLHSNNSAYKPQKSKFPHEQQSIESIKNKLGNQVKFIPNYFLYDSSQNYYLECDLVAVSQDRIAIIELKHWYGEIEIRPHKWILNGRSYRDDPHLSNKYKCQVFKSFYDKSFPTYPSMWIESIVVLTHPDSIVDNAHSYKIDDSTHNLTFENIETLKRHYNYRSGKPELKKLDKFQVEKIANKLRGQSGPPRSKGISFPGYDIVENLTKGPDKAEYLVRPLDNQLQTIKRFRVFIPDLAAPPEERKAQRTKSLNSLKAIERVGDHINIIKVWNEQHEEGYVIEASDWSEQGTLADFIHKQKEISIETAIPIIKGILSGLAAIHTESVIHRDVRPDNILMIKGIPKLMNFDLSYMIEDDRLTVLPETDAIKLTPYMAPELYSDEDLTEAADLFSVGVIFYELLCGHPPLKTALDLDKTKGMLDDNALEKLTAANIPELVQTLLYELIQQKPEKRPQSADAVIEDLDQILTEEEPLLPRIPENRVLDAGKVSSVYEIIELIGKGRQSQVYRAKQTSEHQVAVKLFNNDVLKERIHAEWNALKRVSNPYIVKCATIEQWKDDKRFFLVLNLINGKSLREQIENGEIPKIKIFRKVTQCLLEAVSCMHNNEIHEKPLLHNDIKPENIIIEETGDPILIDFGTAMTPCISAYMGTKDYVAPDLIHGTDMEFCESGDLFALGVTLYEWMFGKKPYPSVPSVRVSPLLLESVHPEVADKLNQWILKAVQPEKEKRFADIKEMKTAFEQLFSSASADEAEEIAAQTPLVAKLPTETALRGIYKNAFVTYLNKLHNATAENEYALAESQALSRHFGSIHVPFMVTDHIYGHLSSADGNHVIITGHAGDGKSTIGLELYKKLKNILPNRPLSQPLKEIEQLRLNDGMVLNIVKDMSELAENRRIDIFLKAIGCNISAERWFIISNTGTLLDTLRAVARKKEINAQILEDRLLRLLEAREPDFLDLFDAPFKLINLTQIDNIHIAIAVFEKIMEENLWEPCLQCKERNACPIYINVSSLREFIDLTSERTGWIYRRLYEYGSRLTMRQMTAHIAYSVTGGLDCKGVHDIMASSIQPPITDFLFFNRFFGFKGKKSDEASLQLKAINSLLPLELGSKPYPVLDRRLWTIEAGRLPELPSLLKPIFKALQNVKQSERNHSRHRQQLRRMLYLFGKMPDDMKSFPASFLDSSMLLESEEWQQNPGLLTSFRKSDLLRKVLHVLQEQFTGFHLPEKTRTNEIYITLSRKNDDLRQSVQIVLAEIPFSNFILEPQPLYRTFKPKRRILVLEEKFTHVSLPLELPFLDFMMKRHSGEIGQGLNASYAQRLERFKAMLLQHYSLKDQLELLELKNTGEFEIRRFVVNQNRLEVV